MVNISNIYTSLAERPSPTCLIHRIRAPPKHNPFSKSGKGGAKGGRGSKAKTTTRSLPRAHEQPTPPLSCASVSSVNPSFQTPQCLLTKEAILAII